MFSVSVWADISEFFIMSHFEINHIYFAAFELWFVITVYEPDVWS
jgi:hypothetical protein